MMAKVHILYLFLFSIDLVHFIVSFKKLFIFKSAMVSCEIFKMCCGMFMHMLDTIVNALSSLVNVTTENVVDVIRL